MFGPIGLPEILLILVLALLIFGPKRLPEVGRTIGKGLAEFRRASADLKRTVNAELALDEDEHTRTPRRPETARALGAGAGRAGAGKAELRAPEGTASRNAPGAPEGAADRAPDAPPTEPPAAPPAGEPEAEAGGAGAETEPAATTH